MKELSIEQKVKAYDKAVINGSRLWECGEITRENYEYIFPELKESDDERIRKHLISLFEKFVTLGVANECETSEIKIDNILSWLEKQNELVEMNPTEFDTRLQALIDTKQNKPVWSEEDEKMLDIILNDINYAQKNFSDSKLIPYSRKINWLKSLKDRVKPQEKQEWSEEEESMIRCLEGFVKDAWAKAETEHDDATVKKMSNIAFFLKTIKPWKK